MSKLRGDIVEESSAQGFLRSTRGEIHRRVRAYWRGCQSAELTGEIFGIIWQGGAIARGSHGESNASIDCLLYRSHEGASWWGGGATNRVDPRLGRPQIS